MDTARRVSVLAILSAFLLLPARPAAARWWVGGTPAARIDLAGGSLEVTLRGDRARPLRLVADGPHHWVFDGPTTDLVGQPYSVILRNRTGERLKVVLGVDGLNVYGREPIVGSSDDDVGSILAPWSERTLPGWQLDLDHAQRFVWSPREWSEGEGRTEAQIGVVTVQVYRERRRQWDLGDGESRLYRAPEGAAHAEPPSALPAPAESAAKASRDEPGSAAPARPQIGTTAGDDVASSVRTIRFESATSYPEAWAEIDYGQSVRAAPARDDAGEFGLRLAPADGGTQITAVVPGSPADRAGLRPWDVIARLDTSFAPDLVTTLRILRGKEPGEYAFVRVRRGPHELAVKVRR